MITTTISYCSRDEKFIHKNIHECLKFSDKVIISCCSHFFDGTPDSNLFGQLNKYINHPKIIIVGIDWDKNSDKYGDCIYWHNKVRYNGYESTKNSGYYLFLDADEIPEGDIFKKYLDSGEYLNYDIIGDFISYYYFRESTYRSKTLSGVGLLINSNYIKKDFLFTPKERWFYRYLDIQAYKINNLLPPKIIERSTFNAEYIKTINFNGYNINTKFGQVMFHHYSWVKSKKEMLEKVTSWGHKLEKNWSEIINSHFDKEFDGKCFVHGWEYESVENSLEIK